MSRATRGIAAGKGGTSTTYTSPEGESQSKRTQDDFLPTDPAKRPLASVGLSLAVGMNTDFGKEKIEVVAWCTLPCDDDPYAISETYNTCYAYVKRETKEKLDDAILAFFPECAPKELGSDS